MFDIVDAHAEAVVADEETAENALWFGEIHGQFGPEKAIQQVVRAVVQCAVELINIQAIQYMAHFGMIVFQTLQHGGKGHGQFQQGGICGFALLDEIQMVGNILYAKAEIFFLGAIQRQFIDTIGQPVIVVLPVIGRQKIFKGFFHHCQPARVLAQTV